MGGPPQDGTSFIAIIRQPMRWRAYKPNSQQARRGIKGRWQALNEYGGWDNVLGFNPDAVTWEPWEPEI